MLPVQAGRSAPHPQLLSGPVSGPKLSPSGLTGSRAQAWTRCPPRAEAGKLRLAEGVPSPRSVEHALPQGPVGGISLRAAPPGVEVDWYFLRGFSEVSRSDHSRLPGRRRCQEGGVLLPSVVMCSREAGGTLCIGSGSCIKSPQAGG